MSQKITGVNPTVKPSGTGCVECSARGGWWLHLRRCAECGHVGCCDTSPSQHATAHNRDTGHPIIASFEPDEHWYYSYITDDFVDAPALAEPTSHPPNQPVPGPSERVPRDWQTQLH